MLSARRLAAALLALSAFNLQAVAPTSAGGAAPAAQPPADVQPLRALVANLQTRVGDQALTMAGQPAAPAVVAAASATPARRWYIPAHRPVISVPILMYHYVRINPAPHDKLGADLSVSPQVFAAQMDWLGSNGYHPVDFDDLRAYYTGGATLPSRPVILTFDDGYKDLYAEAFPILRARGFKAVAYIVSGFLNSKQNVSDAQVVEMSHNGIQIAAHTFSHKDLTAIDAATMEFELRSSRHYLEALLGHPVLDFAYPSGRFNPAVTAAVERAGFATATTTQGGLTHSWSDHLLWTRVRIRGGDSLDHFIAALGTPESAVQQ